MKRAPSGSASACAALLALGACGAADESAPAAPASVRPELAVAVRPTAAASAAAPTSLERDSPAGWSDALESGRPQLLRRAGESRRGRTGRPGTVFALDVVPLDGGDPTRLALSAASWDPDAAGGEDRVLVRAVAADGRATELASVEIERTGWSALDVALPIDAARVELELRGDAALVAVADVALYRSRPEPTTVLLITSDTHRGDHLRVAPGTGAVATPALRALAERGRTFSDCYAASNITVPSHAALMTGVHPRDSGIEDNRTRLAREARTLAEVFRDAGFATFGATSISLLTDDHSGLGQGFDRFASTPRRRSGLQSIEALRAWLPDARGRPLFLWLHVFDAHGPYRPPAELIAAEWPVERDPRDPGLPEPAGRVPDWAPDVRDLDYVRALYRACVRLVDLSLARLLEHPRVRDGIVAFTADHGESLGRHDIWWAHQELFPDTLHVPLVLAWPGGDGARSAAPVRQIDVGRTLLDLAGFARAAFPGRNLLDDAASEWPRFALAERGESIAINWRGWHLIRHLVEHPRGLRASTIPAGRRELFDLARDPAAERDLAGLEGERLAELDAALARWWDERRELGLAAERHADAETLRRLRELGYLGDE